MGKRIAIFLFFLIFLSLIFFLWFKEGTSPVDVNDKTPRIFMVRKGDGLKEISKALKKEDLIRDPVAFFILVRLKGLAKNIQAGDFRLNRSMAASEIAASLTHGTLDVWFTTLEGWRNEEIALELAQELSIPEREFLKYAQEGYMFPDTYLIPREATAAAVVKLFRDNFEKRVDPGLIEKIKQKNVSLEETIILASIIEREARFEEDRPIVAGILLKRLKRKWPLQADATIQYALGYQPKEKTWWKKNLSQQDLKIKSPYNTYENIGLPPAPICNPGLASIKAVVFAKETEYWYYLSDKKGKMHYARTLEEHNQNIATYLK